MFLQKLSVIRMSLDLYGFTTLCSQGKWKLKVTPTEYIFYCKRAILFLSSSKILTPHPPLRPASVLRGEDRLAGREGGWGVNIWKTKEIGLPSYSKICTLWLPPLRLSVQERCEIQAAWTQTLDPPLFTVLQVKLKETVRQICSFSWISFPLAPDQRFPVPYRMFIIQLFDLWFV